MNITGYRFGDYSLDLGKRELMRGPETIALPARVFECLTYLIEHRDRAVHRDELVRAVFGRVDVSDAQLGQIVLRARRTIGDDGQEQRFIRTVPRYGFSWVAPVSVELVQEAVPDPQIPALPPAALSPAVAEGASDSAAPPVADASLPAAKRATARKLPILIAAVVVACIAIGMLAGVLLRDKPAQMAMAEDAFMVLPVQVTGPGDIAWARLGLMDFVGDRMRRAGLQVLPSETTLGAIAQNGGKPDQGRDRKSVV